jgi:cysteine desulfurase/selenocysteine lyase
VHHLRGGLQAHPGERELGAKVRADFPVLSRRLDGMPIVYLDSAATSLKPQSVIDSVSRYYSTVGANIHRGKHYLSEEASAHFEGVRYKMAQYLSVRSNELVFVNNTTAGLNLVAHGLGLTREDLVLVTLDSHHSNILPWQKVARVELVRVDPSGCLDLDHYEELLRRRPKVVALTHCSNVTGIYAPLPVLVPMAKEAGALVVLDAAQSIPHRRVLPAELGVDFMAFSAHKMLGPTGVGILYGQQDRLASLEPSTLGGGAVDWVGEGRYELRKVPHRFESGTPDIAGVYGLASAIDYIERVGLEAIKQHDLELARLLLSEAGRRPFLRILGDSQTAERAAVLSIAVKGCRDLGDVARMLSDSYGVMCRTGHLCAQPLVDYLCEDEVLRLSAYIYNTRDDIMRGFVALDEIYPSLELEAT